MPSVVALIGTRGIGARPRQERPSARRPSSARVRHRQRAPGRRLRPHRLLDRQRQSRGRRWYGADIRSSARRRSLRRRRRTSSGSRDAAAARRALRPVRDRSRDEPLPRARRDPARASSSSSRRPRPTRSAQSSASSSIRGRCGCSTGRPLMRPLLDQSHLDVAWHAGQYQASRDLRAEQRAGDRLDASRRGDRDARGAVLAPFLTAATRASTSTTRTIRSARELLDAAARRARGRPRVRILAAP